MLSNNYLDSYLINIDGFLTGNFHSYLASCYLLLRIHLVNARCFLKVEKVL